MIRRRTYGGGAVDHGCLVRSHRDLPDELRRIQINDGRLKAAYGMIRTGYVSMSPRLPRDEEHRDDGHDRGEHASWTGSRMRACGPGSPSWSARRRPVRRHDGQRGGTEADDCTVGEQLTEAFGFAAAG